MANTSSAKSGSGGTHARPKRMSAGAAAFDLHKKGEAAIDGGDKDAANAALKEAQPELMRGVTRGVQEEYCSAKNLAVVEAYQSHLIWRYLR